MRTLKSFGTGSSLQIVEEYRIDTSLPREMRLTLKQIAQELGQWGKKQELTTADVAPRQNNKVDLSVLSPEEVVELERVWQKISKPVDRSNSPLSGKGQADRTMLEGRGAPAEDPIVDLSVNQPRNSRSSSACGEKFPTPQGFGPQRLDDEKFPPAYVVLTRTVEGKQIDGSHDSASGDRRTARIHTYVTGAPNPRR